MADWVMEVFEVELQNLLYNLYDPGYAASPDFYAVLRVDPALGLDGLRAKILDAIDSLKTNTGFSQPTKSDLLYEILTARFIQGLSQEKAAEQLHMSSRHLRRKQNEAVHALASRLWQAAQTPPAAQRADPGAQGKAWTDMMVSELEVLHKNAPATTADAAETLQRAADLAAYLPGSERIQLRVRPCQVEIKLPIHPTVLQQMILNLIGKICQSGYSGEVQLACARGENGAEVIIALAHQPQGPRLELGQIEALAGALGAVLETRQETSGDTILLALPQERRVTVLVVDDNSQVVQLYQRHTAKTRYEITHVTSGSGLIERLETNPVDILMIDILLPDIDGWELLLQLRHNPHTARIPVVICSVLGNEEMARKLGAAFYLPKPIDRQALLAALDAISAAG
jgi:CheY-like chemotaxis protein